MALMRIFLAASLLSLLCVAPGMAALPPSTPPGLDLYGAGIFPQGNDFVAGNSEFYGYRNCTPQGAGAGLCTGPFNSIPTDVQNISPFACGQLQFYSQQAAGESGTCQPAGLEWSFAGQCYPFVAMGLSLATCAEDAFECRRTTFFGLHLTASCASGPYSF